MAILGDEKKNNFDDSLAEVVNGFFDNREDVKFVLESKKRQMYKIATSFDGIYFHHALEEIMKDGYNRFPRPSELFKIIFDSKQKRENKDKELAENVLSEGFEWLSLAIEIKEDGELIVYFEPVIHFEDWAHYDPELMTSCSPKQIIAYSEKFCFKDIGKIFSRCYYVPCGALPDDFIELIYGRKLKDFPVFMACTEMPVIKLEKGLQVCVFGHSEERPYSIREITDRALFRGVRDGSLIYKLNPCTSYEVSNRTW